MKLYLVTQWGNESDPDGPDAIFNTAVLVRANSLENAVLCAENTFRKYKHERTSPEAGHVAEIGRDDNSSNEECVVFGPMLVSQFSQSPIRLNMWQRNYGPEEWTQIETA